jgi:hypothetical protein
MGGCPLPAKKTPSKTVSKTVSKSGPRKTIKEAMDSALDPEGIEALIREALSTEKEVAVDVELDLTCPNPKCRHKFRKRPRVRVNVPDWNAREKFLKLAIEHTQGRAPQAAQPKAKPKITGSLEELTDEQLEALLEVEDGEIDGSPA